MYQPLIWGVGSRNDPRGMFALRYAQNLQRLSDALVDSVWGNSQLCSNFLGRMVLVNHQQAVELPLGQFRNRIIGIRIVAVTSRFTHLDALTQITTGVAQKAFCACLVHLPKTGKGDVADG